MESETINNAADKDATLHNQDASGRLRDEKGHFLPDPDKKVKKIVRKKDDNTVKIRVVRDKNQLPKTDYEGRLEDIKERTATNFIKAVISRQPNKISIDGNVYYSKNVYDDIKTKLEYEKDNSAKGITILKKAMDTILQTEECLKISYSACQKIRQSRFWWRNIAISAIVMFITGLCTMTWTKYQWLKEQKENSQQTQVSTEVQPSN